MKIYKHLSADHRNELTTLIRQLREAVDGPGANANAVFNHRPPAQPREPLRVPEPEPAIVPLYPAVI